MCRTRQVTAIVSAAILMAGVIPLIFVAGYTHQWLELDGGISFAPTRICHDDSCLNIGDHCGEEINGYILRNCDQFKNSERGLVGGLVSSVLVLIFVIISQTPCIKKGTTSQKVLCIVTALLAALTVAFAIVSQASFQIATSDLKKADGSEPDSPRNGFSLALIILAWVLELIALLLFCYTNRWFGLFGGTTEDTTEPLPQSLSNV